MFHSTFCTADGAPRTIPDAAAYFESGAPISQQLNYFQMAQNAQLSNSPVQTLPPFMSIGGFGASNITALSPSGEHPAIVPVPPIISYMPQTTIFPMPSTSVNGAPGASYTSGLNTGTAPSINAKLSTVSPAKSDDLSSTTDGQGFSCCPAPSRTRGYKIIRHTGAHYGAPERNPNCRDHSPRRSFSVPTSVQPPSLTTGTVTAAQEPQASLSLAENVNCVTLQEENIMLRKQLSQLRDENATLKDRLDSEEKSESRKYLVNELARVKQEAQQYLSDNETLHEELDILEEEIKERTSALAAYKYEANKFSCSGTEGPLAWENERLRQQLSELGNAYYKDCQRRKSSPEETGEDVKIVLSNQLLEAHQNINRLKKDLKIARMEANNAQDSISEASRTAGYGKGICAVDPNEVPIQQATLDSLVVQTCRIIGTGCEKLKSVSTCIRDVAQTDLNYAQNDFCEPTKLQDILSRHLTEICDVTGDFEKLLTASQTLRAKVFDPRKNNPFCPCRPRRNILEDDLDHLQNLLKDSHEQIRMLRRQMLEYEIAYLRLVMKSSQSSTPLQEANLSRKQVCENTNNELFDKLKYMENSFKKLNEEVQYEKGLRRQLNEKSLTAKVFGKIENTADPTKIATEVLHGKWSSIGVYLVGFWMSVPHQLESQASHIEGTLKLLGEAHRPNTKSLANRQHLMHEAVEGTNELRKASRSIRMGGRADSIKLNGYVSLLQSLAFEPLDEELDTEEARLIRLIDKQAADLRRITKEVDRAQYT